MGFRPSAEFYNELGLKYEAAFAHDAGSLVFLQRAFDLLPPHSTVLDIGSGSGIPTSQMAIKRGHSLHGIDFSPKMVEISRRQVPEGTFTHTDMLDYAPPPDTKFDAVFAMLSLFFTREQMIDFVARIASWTTPGGYLFVGTMLAEDFSPELDAGELDAQSFEHDFMGRKISNLLFTWAGWSNVLENAGFELVFTEKSNFTPPADAGCGVEPHFYMAARRPLN